MARVRVLLLAVIALGVVMTVLHHTAMQTNRKGRAKQRESRPQGKQHRNKRVVALHEKLKAVVIGDGKGLGKHGTKAAKGEKSPHKFADLEEHLAHLAPKEIWGPAAPAEWVEAHEKTGCNVLKVPFDPDDDKRCTEYLADINNWGEIHVMPQKYDARTIKFKVKMKDGMIQAVVKVPQKLFPTEPFGEVGAYHADRVLQLNRVPPSTLTKIPVQRLLDSVDNSPHLKLVPEFKGDYKSFRDMVERDMDRFGRQAGYITNDEVVVSAQLWVLDVRRFLSSYFRIPYQHGNGTWVRWLNPDHPFAEEHRVGMYHMSELVTFDFLLNNFDRTPNKNNFIVGGDPKGGNVHPGPPSFVHLDNGLCFNPGRTQSPFRSKNWKMCIFMEKLVRRLEELNPDDGFAKAMKSRASKSLLNAIGGGLSRVQKRIAEVLHRVEECLEKYPRDVVLTA